MVWGNSLALFDFSLFQPPKIRVTNQGVELNRSAERKRRGELRGMLGAIGEVE